MRKGRARDPRGLVALGGLGLVVAISLSIVGIAYAESGGLFADHTPVAPSTPSTVDAADTDLTEPSASAQPSASPEPSPQPSSAAIGDPSPDPRPSDKPGKTEPKPKPSETPKGGPATHQPSGPHPAYVPETLDQIVSAINAFRASRGVAAFQPFVDGCAKVATAWSDASAGGKLSAALIAENVGPLTRAATAPVFIAAQAEWTDDGSSGGEPAVKIRVYRCDPSTPSPSGSPDQG